MKLCLVQNEKIGKIYYNSLVKVSKAKLSIYIELRKFDSNLLGIKQSDYLQFLDGLIWEVFMEDYPELRDYYSTMVECMRFTLTDDNNEFNYIIEEIEKEFEL